MWSVNLLKNRKLITVILTRIIICHKMIQAREIIISVCLLKYKKGWWWFNSTSWGDCPDLHCVNITVKMSSRGSTEEFLVHVLLIPLFPSGTIMSHPASLSPSPYFQAKSHSLSTSFMVIPHLPSSVLVLLLPPVSSFLPHCLCFIERGCDYMGFCVCLTGVKDILSQIFPLYLYHTQAHTHTYMHVHTQQT